MIFRVLVDISVFRWGIMLGLGTAKFFVSGKAGGVVAAGILKYVFSSVATAMMSVCKVAKRYKYEEWISNSGTLVRHAL